MIKKVFITTMAVVSLVALAGSETMAGNEQGCGTDITRDVCSGQCSISFAQLQQCSQSNPVIGELSEASLLSSILDKYIEDDPNDDPNESEEFLLSGGGGGSGGSSSGLLASNPYAGSSGTGGLMFAPAPQSTGSAAYGDTLFAATPAPIEEDADDIITPTPYPGDGNTTVPEPTTIAMLGLGALGLLRKRKS